MMTQWLVEQSGNITSAQACQLGPVEQELENEPAVLQEQILNALNSGACPEGVYHVNGMIFIAQGGKVNAYQAPQITP
jgi:hypothetical protein